jgi:hypothetical protein
MSYHFTLAEFGEKLQRKGAKIAKDAETDKNDSSNKLCALCVVGVFALKVLVPAMPAYGCVQTADCGLRNIRTLIFFGCQ